MQCILLLGILDEYLILPCIHIVPLSLSLSLLLSLSGGNKMSIHHQFVYVHISYYNTVQPLCIIQISRAFLLVLFSFIGTWCTNRSLITTKLQPPFVDALISQDNRALFLLCSCVWYIEDILYIRSYVKDCSSFSCNSNLVLMNFCFKKKKKKKKTRPNLIPIIFF